MKTKYSRGSRKSLEESLSASSKTELRPYCKDCAGLVCSQFYHFWSKELWPLSSLDCNPLDLAM
ncbi:Hypothetical protein FKW44_011099 [Caligus rogercresseyi]|uniref:Uncharacterized protein n=1 Tax=Caligus rogercresseyi TaxID=217165 RepID=A0A7T8HHU5_CALRO|nr:Hypothetical protein FKW44_011099 [Caligus rogercresseyi]